MSDMTYFMYAGFIVRRRVVNFLQNSRTMSGPDIDLGLICYLKGVWIGYNQWEEKEVMNEMMVV